MSFHIDISKYEFTVTSDMQNHITGNGKKASIQLWIEAFYNFFA